MPAHYIGGAHGVGDGKVHPAPADFGNGEMPQISKDMALVLVLAQDPNVKIDKGEGGRMACGNAGNSGVKWRFAFLEPYWKSEYVVCQPTGGYLFVCG